MILVAARRSSSASALVDRRLLRRSRSCPGMLAQRKLERRLAGAVAPLEPSRRRRRGRWSRCSKPGRCRRSIASSAAPTRGSALGALDRAVGREGQHQRRAADRARLVRGGVGARRRRWRRDAPMRMADRRGASASSLPFMCPEGQADAAAAHVRGAVPRGARPDLARAQGRPRVRDRAEDGRRRDDGAGRTRVPQDVRRAELRPAAEGRARQPDRCACRCSTCGSSRPRC